MLILLFFAFISGLITILAPCIWPLLPIVLSSSATGGKKKPLGITLGIMLSFTFFTLTISYIVKIIPFDPNILRIFAVIVIGFLGLTLIVPQLNQLVEGFVSRLSSKFGPANKNKGTGFWAGFITGFSLGIVWSPCAGPILATIATLSATQSVNFGIILVTLVYVTGVGIPLFLFAAVGNRIFKQSRGLNKYTGTIQKVFGVIMILTAVAIATNFDKTLQAKLLDLFPSYSNTLNAFESNKNVKNQLNELKQNGTSLAIGEGLGNYGKAPEFTGISQWLNSKPLTMKNLKGKVVLIDFWTYTCINCIRTLPHVTSWYEKYKDKGFVVVGVHTPEFEFEKSTYNVQDALKRYNIHYPVAQDNDYGTWSAYNNQYWPAEYLIDANGVIRHTHFGEGEYDQTEQYIQKLLNEAGQKVDASLDTMPDTAPQSHISPETYLGMNRMERYYSKEDPALGRQVFTIQDSLPLHYFGFTGMWDLTGEYAESQGSSTIEFKFSAAHVYLVMHPAMNGDKVKVYLDDKEISAAQSGKDVKNGEVILDTERLYDLVNLKEIENHVLKLEFENNGTKCYAFTFG
jgi:cytochrome c biogenesis protein CcdA/thiol-disulfide isomerase/thioredoxin